MAVSKIRFYKNVTPPTGRINAKSFKVTVKAVNSLGATVNSLGVVVKSLRDGMVAEMEDARKAAALARDKARENKNYKEADRIRDEHLDKGVLIEDKDGKTLWKFK